MGKPVRSGGATERVENKIKQWEENGMKQSRTKQLDYLNINYTFSDRGRGARILISS